MPDANDPTPTPVPAPPLHPGLVSTKLSFVALDGTYTSVEVSAPFTADPAVQLAAIEERLAQAELQLYLLRERFHPFGAEITPANFPVPFGKYRDKTLGFVLEQDPDYFRWMVEEADNASAMLKHAGRLLLSGGEQGARHEPDFAAPKPIRQEQPEAAASSREARPVPARRGGGYGMPE